MNAEREALRETAREFVRREVEPYLQDWEDAGSVPRDPRDAMSMPPGEPAAPADPARSSPARTLLLLAAVSATYYLGARLGFVLRFPPAITSVIWPPNALLTAALLLTEPRRWWLCVAAALPAHGIPRLDAAQFQNQRWATRARPWVDRLASAWLIRRFIDPGAQWVWLTDPASAPADVLGFDYDGARFTHVGALVTFEVLIASFGLETDPRLQRLARAVHYLDAGGMPVPEAAGLEAVLAGLREVHADDDTLTQVAAQVFDALYAVPPPSPPSPSTVPGAAP